VFLGDSEPKQLQNSTKDPPADGRRVIALEKVLPAA